MKIKDMSEEFPEFYRLWMKSPGNTLCDEYMRLKGFNSAKFVITSTIRGEETGYWDMDDKDFYIFYLLWSRHGV